MQEEVYMSRGARDRCWLGAVGVERGTLLVFDRARGEGTAAPPATGCARPKVAAGVASFTHFLSLVKESNTIYAARPPLLWHVFCQAPAAANLFRFTRMRRAHVFCVKQTRVEDT